MINIAKENLEINFMDTFGGAGGALQVSWEKMGELEDFPKAMRVHSSAVNLEASYANFICYCDKYGIDPAYISGLSGFSLEQIESIICDAKEFEIYEELAENFLKK